MPIPLASIAGVIKESRTFDTQIVSTEFDVGNSGAGTVTLNFNNGNCQKVTMTGNCTFGAPSNLLAGALYTLRLVEDATGSRSPSWNAVFKFENGTPALSGANETDILYFYCDGTNLYCLPFEVSG